MGWFFDVDNAQVWEFCGVVRQKSTYVWMFLSANQNSRQKYCGLKVVSTFFKCNSICSKIYVQLIFEITQLAWKKWQMSFLSNKKLKRTFALPGFWRLHSKPINNWTLHFFFEYFFEICTIRSGESPSQLCKEHSKIENNDVDLVHSIIRKHMNDGVTR